VPVTVVDESGREWPMTYRCVPHRYSYELRAGAHLSQAGHFFVLLTPPASWLELRPGYDASMCPSVRAEF